MLLEKNLNKYMSHDTVTAIIIYGAIFLSIFAFYNFYLYARQRSLFRIEKWRNTWPQFLVQRKISKYPHKKKLEEPYVTLYYSFSG